MSTTVVKAGEIEGSYLTDGMTIRSWLLTTDHKRIALLYLGSTRRATSCSWPRASFCPASPRLPPG